jgi:carbamoyl-phosphate synthase large subunit
VGLLNVQFAIFEDVVHVLEANPRASRTVPWVSKATGVPLARIAMRLILGEPLRSHVSEAWLEPPEPDGEGGGREPRADMPRFDRTGADTGGAPPPERSPSRGHGLPAGRVFVKVPVFSWDRFPGFDTLLGPEMRSTGEVLGIGRDFGTAFAKAAAAAGLRLPLEGAAFLTVNDRDKEELLPIARDLLGLGFRLLATGGTAAFLSARGLPVEPVYKVNEGRPNSADRIHAGEIRLVINTPLGRDSFYDEKAIRRAALARGVPCITTLSGSRAAVDAIRTLRAGAWDVESLQEMHAEQAPGSGIEGRAGEGAPEPRRTGPGGGAAPGDAGSPAGSGGTSGGVAAAP